MVKLPKDAGRIIKILMDKGFQAYAVGGCVRDSLLGLHPYDWDITTSAGLEELKKLFPEAKIISEKYSVNFVLSISMDAAEMPENAQKDVVVSL